MAEGSSMEVFEKIKKCLDEKAKVYKTVAHEATYTSEESARARGEDLSIGGKAILMKVDDAFGLFVLSASKKINSKALKQTLKAKRLRFSTSDELLAATDLVPGSVPPFGAPIFPELKLYVDNSILANSKIAFNAGSLTNSIVLELADYLDCAKPEMIFDFSE